METKKKFYVTFQFPTYPDGYKKYAVDCGDDEGLARETAADAYSLDGIKYLKINRCGRVSKDHKIIQDARNYTTEL